MGNENRTSAPSGTFETADGKLNIAANKQQQFEILCKALGRDELLDDARFRTREDRKRHRAELRSELERTLRTQSARHWDEVLLPTGVPAAPVVSVPEALESDQVAHRRLVSTLPSPACDGGEVHLLGSATHVDGRSVAPASPPPTLGEHTRQVLTDLGYNEAQIEQMAEEGAV